MPGLTRAIRARPLSGPDAAGAAILANAGEAFDRRLDPTSRAPIAVGFSGGGDSLALLLAARAWAARTGRRLLALTVDHGLNPGSGRWTSEAGALARSLGVEFLALSWRGEKPRTGLPAAARRARHALLADAARGAGASVLLLGHTLDDVKEAVWMRAWGSSVGVPRQWAPPPVWPEGRDLFLLRPLLGLGRAELRELLSPSGLAWIEDPANDDGRFLRARARQRAPADAPSAEPAETVPPFQVDAAGGVLIPRQAGRRLLAMACVSAGGGERLPRGRHLDGLLTRLTAGERFAATLTGARIIAADEVRVIRDLGRSNPPPEPLPQGRAVVWDGRFEIIAHRPGLAVRPLGGLMSRLEKASRPGLRAFPSSARPTLPAITDADGNVTCPILAQGAWSSARTLVGDRLEAACGRITREPALAPGSHGEWGEGALS